ncbi:MAG: hypothetical protein ACM3KI_11170 [Bacillota bacterium]
MAYQLKYYFYYKPLKATNPNIVEIWQNTNDVLLAEEITGAEKCFNVELPKIDNKFQVVRGRGCTINMLSETDMKFFNGLYHVDPQEFMIIHRLYGEDFPNFLGYLNAEMVTEPYDIDFNYTFSITGNDGFGLMDRFYFLQSDATKYTGIKSKFELLQIVFSKIGLDYDEYRIALSTTFNGYSGSTSSSILKESYIWCENFYDEDGKPMTLREVVESILAPYGAHIFAEDGHIYIQDIHTLASNSSVTYKRFALSTGNYLGQIAVPNQKTIASIGYKGNGQLIELSGGVNRQVIEYSAYPLKEVLEESIINTTEFVSVPISYSTKNGYKYKTLQYNKYWETTALGGYEISYFENESDANTYIWWARHTSTNDKVASLIDTKYVVITGSTITPVADRNGVYSGRYRLKFFDGAGLLIKGKVLVKTKDNPYNSDQQSKDIVSLDLSMRVKIGDYYLNNSGLWTTTPANILVTVSKKDRSNIADQFVDFTAELKIGNYNENITLYGELDVQIWSEVKTYSSKNIDPVTNSTDVKEIWINQISIDITTYDFRELPDKDISYIGLLNKLYANEGEVINLRCGTDMYFSDKGKILQYDGSKYFDITLWTRAGQTYKIEELLLASLSANYRAGFITLTNMKLKNAFKINNILTDTFLGSKKLMISESKIDFWNDVNECSLVEISPDDLTIIKDSTIA